MARRRAGANGHCRYGSWQFLDISSLRHAENKLAFKAALGEEFFVTCTVKVANGSVPLPPGVKLPDGAEVQLTIPDPSALPTFGERYAAYIGVADDLPTDLAANLDHYVHGHRKK